MPKDHDSSPSPKAKQPNLTPSPVNGQIPPVEHRIKPGEVRNPHGSRRAGAVVRDWMNRLADKDLSLNDLKIIAENESEPQTRRIAAVRLIEAAMFGIDGRGSSEFVVSHTDGKAVGREEISGPGGMPLSGSQFDASKLSEEDRKHLFDLMQKALASNDGD